MARERLHFSPPFILAGILGLAIGVGVLARFYSLGSITSRIFDEVYFPVMAVGFLHHQLVFDVHPPFGKLLIAIGIWLFGDTPFGWRIIPALFGVALLPLAALTAWRPRKSIAAAAFIAVFMSLDGALIAYSRTGLMDGLMLFLIVAATCIALRVKTWRSLLLLAVLVGLAASIKWVAIAVLPPVAYLLWRQRKLVEAIPYLPVAVGTYFSAVLVGEWIGRVAHPVQAALQWQNTAMTYHLALNATHPWSSRWWTWPLELRPVLLYYQESADGRISLMTTLGNPILWWLSTLAVISAVVLLVHTFVRNWRTALDHPLVPLLIGYFSAWLPWALVHRIVFQYHYLPAYFFALLILTYFLERLWDQWNARWGAIVILLVVTLGGIYFLPFTIATPLTTSQISHRVWIQSWLY